MPDVEDHAITFTHYFHPNDFAKGKEIVINGFSNAILESGGTRRTYFMSRPENAEVLAISFFHKGTSSNVWMDSAGRESVLKQLRPLYREPLRVRRYHAEHIHDSHSIDEYYPQVGDEFIVYDHVFTSSTYEKGKEISVSGYADAIGACGLTKRSYFLDDPENSELLITSFFHRHSSVEGWETSADRKRVLASVTPMLSKPMTLQIYRVEAIHVTP